MSHRITSVSVHGIGAKTPAGLKRQTFRLALTGCDLLTGENGAGKTTRGPLAITAAIEGLASVPTDPRRPYVGGLPESTAVTIETTAGAFTRDLSASKGKAVEAANAEARTLIGIPPTAWDLRDFASGTDGDRGKILDAVARAGGAIERWDADRAKARVRVIVTDVDPDVDLDAWTAPLSDCIRALPVAPDAATWLRAAEVWATDAQTKTNAAQREANGYLGEVTASAPPVPEGDADADAAKLRDLRRRDDALSATASELEKVEAAHTRHAAEGERLRKAMESTAAEGARLKEPAPAPDLTIPAEVIARVDAARAAMDAPVGAYEGTDAPEVVDRTPPLRDAAKAATEAAGRARDAHAHAGNAAERSIRKLELARARVDALSEVHGAESTCRHCGEEDPLGVGVALAEAREAHVVALRENESAAEAFAAARAALDAAEKVEREAVNALRAAESTLSTARIRYEEAAKARAGHADTVRARRQRELDAAEAECARELARANERSATHGTAEQRRTADLGAARQRWAAARDALRDWEAVTPPEIPTPPSDEERAALATEIAEAEARVAARRDRAGHVARIEAAAEKYRAAKLRWDATRALVQAIRQARDDMAAAAYTPIDSAARALVDGAPGLPVPYFDGPDAYGAIVPGRGRVPYAGLSESEQRITAAALVYALASVANCPCRLVLVDGIEVVQADHRGPLVAALARAQRAGLVDSVVLTMATAPGEIVPPIDGVTVHVIEREASETPDAAPVRVAGPNITPEADNASDCPF